MPRGARADWRSIGPGVALACCLCAPGRGDDEVAATPSDPAVVERVLPFRSRSFRIPFGVEPADRGRIKEVQLWVSTDLGRSWRAGVRTTPEQSSFPAYHAPRDGEYWFAVRTMDTKGRLFPRDEAEIRPSMRVLVDTTKPTIELAPDGRRGSLAGVRWEIRDEHLKPESLTIEYRAEGARDWRRVPIHEFKLIGAEEWDAATAGALGVRAWVEDQAGNRGVAETSLPAGYASDPDLAGLDRGFEPPAQYTPISSGPPPSGRMGGLAEPTDPFVNPGQPYDAEFDAPRPAPAPRARQAAPAPSARTLLVASPRFALQYEVEDAGPEGPALVELWVTRDGGQTWNRLAEDSDRVSPYDVDLGTEGTFGLWLAVQSAANLGDPPPRPGDRPQLWVEVDSTAPVVRLDPPRVGQGANLGRVLISWKASDPHLGPRPVLLSYRADRPDDPWHPLTERLDNTGKYIWSVPANVPPRVHIRIDVMDSLGNRGFAETQSKPILVDQSRPRGRILGLDASSMNGGPDGRTRR